MQKKIKKANRLCTDFGRYIFYILLVFCIGFASVYMYFIVGITANIVARKGYEQNQKNIQTDISNLEFSYLHKMQELDKDLIDSYGLVKPKEVYFASREHYASIR